MKLANTYRFSKTGFFSDYTLEADFENPVIEPNGAGVKIDGWTHYSPSTTLSVEPHNGSDWLKVVSTNGTHGAHQGFSVEPGETYTFEIDLHRPAGMNKEINVVIWKNTGPSGALSIHVLNTDGFNTFNYTATSSNIYIQIRQAGTYYLDNIRMYRTYEDTIFVSGYEVEMAYRYGYNTQERVDEIAGKGNHYTAPYWEYDPRVVHRWNRDPKPVPSISPYAINQGNPIWFSDPLGDTIQVVNKDGDIEFQINEGKGLDIFKIEDNEKIKDLILVMKRRVLLEKDISNDDKNKAIIEEFGGVRIADKPRLSGRMDTGDSEYDLFFNLAYDYYFNEEKGEKPMKNVFIASEDFQRNYHAASLGEDLGKKDREKLNFYNQIKESTPKFIFQTGIILKVPTREDIKNQSRPINTQPYKP